VIGQMAHLKGRPSEVSRNSSTTAHSKPALSARPRAWCPQPPSRRLPPPSPNHAPWPALLFTHATCRHACRWYSAIAPLGPGAGMLLAAFGSAPFDRKMPARRSEPSPGSYGWGPKPTPPPKGTSSTPTTKDQSRKAEGRS
jgi:hypothetical protein